MAEHDAAARWFVTAVCLRCGRRNRVPVSGTGAVRCGDCRVPLPWIAEADDETFADVAEQASLPVLVDLYAVWCCPCDAVGPALEQVACEMAGRVKLVRVDINRAPRTKARFSAQAVPSLLLIRAGEVINRRAGSAPVDALRDWVESTLARVR
jgi:thioredoxin 2